MLIAGMKTLLFLAEKAELQEKTGAAFGWSGEAAERIFETMENIFKMEMVSAPLMLKSGDLAGGITMAQEYGKDVAAKISN